MKRKTPKFDVPVDIGFFTESLGPNLLTKAASSTPSLVDTSVALQNVRLVAFYFSAHWCGPCRQFTPMLVELYEHLKEEVPSHGLEVVFVSSDRDLGGFNQYYSTMPWMAMSFGSPLTHLLKTRYAFCLDVVSQSLLTLSYLGTKCVEYRHLSSSILCRDKLS